MPQILLQNAKAILLQNATEVYGKMHQVFYYEMRQFYYKMRQFDNKMRQLLQNSTFITNCDSTTFVLYGSVMIHVLFNPLSANITKWSNTLKQFVGSLPTNCLSVFRYFVKLTLKGLTLFKLYYLYFVLTLFKRSVKI